MWEYKTVEESVNVNGYCFQGNDPDACLDIPSSFPNSTKCFPLTLEIGFITIKHKVVFMFDHLQRAGWIQRAAGNVQCCLGLSTCESLVSILSDTKKVCGSAQSSKQECVVSLRFPVHPLPFLFSTEMDPLVKRHLCFLLSLQDSMSWFRTHKCNFKFDCLLVYFMHLLLEEGETWF